MTWTVLGVGVGGSGFVIFIKLPTYQEPGIKILREIRLVGAKKTGFYIITCMYKFGRYDMDIRRPGINVVPLRTCFMLP